MWAYGSVDETGAAIGVAVAAGLDPEVTDLLRRVQNDLFDLGADLAVPLDTDPRPRQEPAADHRCPRRSARGRV